MDVEAYLRRIEYDGPRQPSPTTLRVLHRQHLLTAPFENLDIPLGTVEQVADGKKFYEFTSWTTANDLTNRTFYFHTHDNRRVRRIALMKADLNADHIVTFRSKTGQDYEDLQSTAGH